MSGEEIVLGDDIDLASPLHEAARIDRKAQEEAMSELVLKYDEVAKKLDAFIKNGFTEPALRAFAWTMTKGAADKVKQLEDHIVTYSDLNADKFFGSEIDRVLPRAVESARKKGPLHKWVEKRLKNNQPQAAFVDAATW